MVFVLRLGSKATAALNDPTKSNLSHATIVVDTWVSKRFAWKVQQNKNKSDKKQRTCANDLLPWFLPILAQALLIFLSNLPPRDPPSGAQAWTNMSLLLFSVITSPGWYATLYGSWLTTGLTLAFSKTQSSCLEEKFETDMLFVSFCACISSKAAHCPRMESQSKRNQWIGSWVDLCYYNKFNMGENFMAGRESLPGPG